MTYKEFKETSKDFQSIFGITPFKFLDSVLFLAGIMTIDIVRFDDFLRDKYGDYESEGMSMEEVIRKYYGEDGAKLIKRYIDSI